MAAHTASRPRIAVFDSGVGGLSIFASIRARLPAAQMFFCADNAHFPYGTKSDAELVQIITDVAQRLISACDPHVFVVACNTASTLILPVLRARHAIPFVGTVPAIKPAAQQSKSRIIGILATEATVRRPYLDDLVREHAAGTTVLRFGSRRLVDLAERKIQGETLALEEIRQEIAPLFEDKSNSAQDPFARMDAVVLGCTHFPLLVDEFKQVSPWPVEWIDSGKAIAERVAFLLDKSPAPQENSALWSTFLSPAAPFATDHMAYFTGPLSVSEAKKEFMCALGVRQFESLPPCPTGAI